MTSRTFSRRQALKGGAAALLAASFPAKASTGATPHSAISTPNPHALAAAAPILANGGNAIDAAVAALSALCVVELNNVGFMGYGGSFAIYLSAESRVTTIDFDARAPVHFEPGRFTEQNANHGFLAPATPGVLAGMDYALRKYGTVSWKTVLAHARRLAADGFVVDAELRTMFDEFVPHADPVSFFELFPNGAVPNVGDVFAQKNLARTIDSISRHGADAIYRGDIGRRIVRHLQENGGILTEEDFREFHATENPPLKISYRGAEIFTPPPPSAGLTSFGILKTLENFDLTGLPPWGADYFHLFAQAARICWQERLRLFGDPDFVHVPIADLLSQEAAAKRAELIRDNRIAGADSGPAEPQHTVNVVVIDGQQNIVSLTATHGGDFGSRVVVPGTGLVLGHGMSRFAFRPGPNFPAPRKRMQHNMAPMIALRDGKPWMGFGMPGGRTIVTVTPQFVIDVIDFKAGAAQAIKAPRLHVEADEPIKVDANVPAPVAEGLQGVGHRVVYLPKIGGSANVALIQKDSGVIDAAAGNGASGVQIT